MPGLLGYGVGVATAAMAVLALVSTLIGWPAWQTAGPIALESGDTANHTHWATYRAPIIVLGISYTATAVAFVPYTIFWFDYIARGLSAGIRQAAMCWMLFGIAAAAGPLLCAQMAGRMGTVRALRWALMANCLAVVLPLASSRLSSLTVSSIGAGSMGLGIPFLTATRAREISPPGGHQRLWAGMTIIYAIAYAAAGWVFSSVFAAVQSYRFLFAWSGVALLAGGLTQYFGLPRVRHASEEETSSKAA